MRKSLVIIHADPYPVMEFDHYKNLVIEANNNNIILTTHWRSEWIDIMTSGDISYLMSQKHENGYHHHGANHPTSPDGYSNDPVFMTDSRYKGSMADYLNKFSKLNRYVELTSASMSDEEYDWIDTIHYDSNGINNLDTEYITLPSEQIFKGVTVASIGHYFPMYGGASLSEINSRFNLMKSLYDSDRVGVCSVVFHIKNFITYSQQIKDWFKFLSFSSIETIGIKQLLSSFMKE